MVKTGGILGLAVCSFALTSFAIDWPGEGGTYTVPAGETNTVTEADIAAVNKLAKIVFADKDSALLFTSTTAPAVKFSGTGTVIKEGAADWTLSMVQDDTSFRGNWDIREGTVRVGAIGGNTSNTTLFPDVVNPIVWRHCWIRKGVTFVYDVSGNFRYVTFHLAGTLKCEANATSASFHAVSLDDDAVIDQSSGKYVFFSRPSDDGGVSLDLNGHTLTCKLATNIYLYRGTVAGPGTIRLENVTEKACGFYLRSEGSVRGFTDPTVTLECGDNTGFYLQGHPTNPQVATLVVEGKGFLAHAHKDETCAAHPDACLFWDGPVVLTNTTSVLNVNNMISEDAHVGIRGKVSGPGSLAFATSSSYASGTYYLTNGGNDFTGSLTLNSRANVLYRMTGTVQKFASMNLANVAVDWTLVPSDTLVRPTEKIRVDEYYTKDENSDRLKVGDRAFGKLTIVEGVSITERLCLSSYSQTTDAKVRGVIRQTGGDLSLIGQYKDSNQTYSSILGNWGQGGYSLEGGTLTFLGHCNGANYGNLVFCQSGGTLKVVKYPWGTQASDPNFSLGVDCGTGDLIFTGGTADLGAVLYMGRGSNAEISPQTLSSLTVDGTAEVSMTSVFTYNKDGCVSTVNLRGGRLTAQWYASSSSTPYDAWVYFDGGTFALRRDLIRGEFGGDDATHAPATLRVGPNGGTLDAQNHYQKLYTPFNAQQDGVVTAIPWTDTTTVYPAPPTVVISGPGRHATAYADYDYATGRIRGIVVTCGGEGYVAGETTAQLEYCHANLKGYPREVLLEEPIVCTVGNVTSGGMTFRASGVASGSNYIGICCTNTYAGATTVDMQTDPDAEKPGILYCYADDQFPNSHKLVVRSGQLAFNSYAQGSFTELEMSGGKMLGYPSGQQMTLEQATFAGTPNLGNVPMTVGKIVVDAANPPTLTLAKITAADGAKITIKNAAVLADIKRGVTLFTCDITDGAKITVENPDDLPANVKLVWSNGRLRASRTDIGCVLIVR